MITANSYYVADSSDFTDTTGAGTDGYSVVWDNGTSAFILTDIAAGAGHLLASGTVTGATSQAQVFTNGVTSTGVLTVGQYIRPDADATDAIKFQNAAGTTDLMTFDSTNGHITTDHEWTGDNLFGLPVRAPYAKSTIEDKTFGQSFDTNTTGTPTGWTVTDSAASSREDQIPGFWYIRGNSSNAAYDFSKQVSITTTEYPGYLSAHFQDIYFRDGQFTADINYYFAIHADDSSSPDANDYVRVNLWWDQANSLWKVRGELNEGGSETLSSWQTLSFPLVFPMHFRLALRYLDGGSSGVRRAYVGTSPMAQSQAQLQSPTNTVDYQNPHIKISQSRGTGVEDYLFIGSVDFSNNT